MISLQLVKSRYQFSLLHRLMLLFNCFGMLSSCVHWWLAPQLYYVPAALFFCGGKIIYFCGGASIIVVMLKMTAVSKDPLCTFLFWLIQRIYRITLLEIRRSLVFVERSAFILSSFIEILHNAFHKSKPQKYQRADSINKYFYFMTEIIWAFRHDSTVIWKM